MLTKLQDAPNFQLDKDEPDVRGWTVFDKDCNSIGKVDSLILDTDAEQIRYLSLEVLGDTRMVPIGMLDIDEEDRQVILRRSDLDVGSFPSHPDQGFTPEQEKQYYTTFVPEQGEMSYQRPEFEHKSNRLQLLEEKLRIGKREVPKGEAVARKRVEEHPVGEEVTLREERPDIERHPVNKPLSQTEYASTQGQAFQEGQEVRMPVMGEEAVVQKEPFVKEEVILNKTEDTRTERVGETVRSEEVEFVGTEPEGREGGLAGGQGTSQPQKEKDKPSLGEKIKRNLGM